VRKIGLQKEEDEENAENGGEELRRKNEE